MSEDVKDQVKEDVSEETAPSDYEIMDQDEYERALEVLDKGKNKRVKDIKEKKKVEKKAAMKSAGKTSFIEKCKKDPVIPICILLAVAVVIGVFIYYALPAITLRSFDFTPEEMAARYKETEIFKNSLTGYNFEIPSVTYDQGEDGTVDNTKFTGFSAPISNTATSFGTGIQGTVRNSDGKVTSIRVLVEYSETSDYYSFLLIYFGSFLQTVYPDISSDEAVSMAEEAIGGLNDPSYTVKGDYAYDVSMSNDSGLPFIMMDILPASELGK